MKSNKNKKQILMKGITILLVALFILTPIGYATTSLDDSYLDGSFWEQLLYGTVGSTAKEIEEYLKTHTTLYIYNETQLRALAEYVNSGHNCSGKEVILMSDIEIDKEVEWVPIGNATNSFTGTFDGKNYTISGVSYTNEGKINLDFTTVGLFGFVGQRGVIKNVITKDFNINIVEEKNFLYISAGNIAGSSNGTIENCINKSNIYGVSTVGGIVGRVGDGKTVAIINNCTNEGIIEGDGATGGIVGSSAGGNPTSMNPRKQRYNPNKKLY